MSEDNITEAAPVDNTAALETLQTSNDSLLNKNSELLNELKQVKSSLAELGGLDQIKTIVTETQANQQAKLEENNSIEELKEHFNAQIAQANNKNDELVNGIVQNQIDTHLRSAVTKAKGSYTLLEHQLKNQVSGEYENGKVKLTITDSNGMPMMTEGKDASLTDLVDSFKTNDDFARAFDAVANISGSGTPVGGQTTINKQPETLSEITELYKTNPAKAMEVMKAKGLA